MKVGYEEDYNMEFVSAATLLLNHTRLFKRISPSLIFHCLKTKSKKKAIGRTENVAICSQNI